MNNNKNKNRHDDTHPSARSCYVWKPFNINHGIGDYENKRVLFLVNSKPYIGEYSYVTGGGGYISFDNNMVATPSHWMPIPKYTET